MELYTRWPLGSGFFRSAKLSGCGAVGVRGSSLFLLRTVRVEGALPFVHWAVGRHFHDFPFLAIMNKPGVNIPCVQVFV